MNRNIKKVAVRDNMNVIVETTTPKLEDTFWVNLIGRGYPAPNSIFRWCTERLKINPTTKRILDKISRELDVREFAIDNKERELDKRERELRKKESKVYFGEENVEDTFSSFRKIILDDEEREIYGDAKVIILNGWDE